MLAMLDSLGEAVEGSLFDGTLCVPCMSGVVLESNEMWGKLYKEIPNELYKSGRYNWLTILHPHSKDHHQQPEGFPHP